MTEEWCQPGDIRKRQFIVTFDDPDCRRAVFDDETDARKFWGRASLNYNCYLFGAMPRDPAPAESVLGIELTEWERSKLAWHASSSAMTYVSHHVTGRHGKSGLSPDEIEEMERWKVLSAKLQPAATSEGSTDAS